MKKVVFIILLFTNFAYAEDIIIKTTQDAFELYSVGNFEDAAATFEEASYMMRENAPDDIKGRIKISLYAGLSYKEIYDYNNSLKWLTDAFNLATEVGDKKYAIKILSNIADIQRLDGAYEEAVKNYNTVLKSTYVSEQEKAALYYGLADSYRLMEKYDLAFEICEKSIPLSKKFSMDKLYLSCSIIEGETYRINGDYAKSLQSFSVALDVGRARNYYDISVAAMNGIGLVSEKLKRNDAARNSFHDALVLSLKNEDFENVTLITDKIISLLPESGNFNKQGDELLDIINKLSHIKDNELKLSIYKLISKYYKLSKSYEKLLISTKEWYNASLDLNNNEETSQSLYYTSLAFFHLKKYGKALDKTDEAISRLKTVKNQIDIDKIYALQAECYFYEDDIKDATSSLKQAINYCEDSKRKSTYQERLKEMLSSNDDDVESNETSTDDKNEKQEDKKEIRQILYDEIF